MSQATEDTVQRWLEEAAAAMGGDAASRRDVLLELETTIQERVDERSRSGVDIERSVRDVLEAMGDPADVGGSFMPMQPLVAANQTRAFLIYAWLLFAVHFLMVIGATMAGRALSGIQPIGDPRNVLEVLARAVETLLLDAGAVLCAFVLFRRLGLILRFPRASLTVRPDRRRRLQGAFFMVLVLIVANFFRDDLLALYFTAGAEAWHVPLVGPGIVDNLVLFNVWLGLAVARELFYAHLGERLWTLGVDLFSNSVGLFCLLRLVATKRLVDLSPAADVLGQSAEGVGALLNTALTIICLVTAVLLAARLVRRAFRLVLLR